mgnify:CR=1 FL=1
MAAPTAYEQNLSMTDWDRQVTKVATGYVLRGYPELESVVYENCLGSGLAQC